MAASTLPPELWGEILKKCTYTDLLRTQQACTTFQQLTAYELQRRPAPLIGLYVLWSLQSNYRTMETYCLQPWDRRQLVVHKAVVCTGQPNDDLFEPWWAPLNDAKLRGDCWLFNNNIELRSQEHFELELVYRQERLHLKRINDFRQATPKGTRLFIEGQRICGNLHKVYDRVYLATWRQLLGPGHHQLSN